MAKIKPSDAETVREYMHNLQHPLKNEIEKVRSIILGANENIRERVKWKAPSYYFGEDLVTFNHRATEYVHLVFHHTAITSVQSPFLKGEYKDRRMMYFHSMEEIEAQRPELERIVNELVALVSS